MLKRLLCALVVVSGCGSAPVGLDDGGAGAGGEAGGGGSSGGGGSHTVGLGLTVEAKGKPIGYAVDFDAYSVTVFQPDTKFLFRVSVTTGYLTALPQEILPLDFLSGDDCATLYYGAPTAACETGQEALWRPVWAVDQLGDDPPGGAVGLAAVSQERPTNRRRDSYTSTQCEEITFSVRCVLAVGPVDLPTAFDLPIDLTP